MRIDLQYGEGTLRLEDGTLSTMEELRPKTAVGFEDLRSEIDRVLMSPVGTDSLPSLIACDDSVAVVVEGPVLHTHAGVVLDAILSILIGKVVDPEQVTVIVSANETGTTNLAEWDKRLGSPTSRGFSLSIHDPHRDERLIEIGTTPTHSVPIQLNGQFASADFKIGIGAIHQSTFTGATGGRAAVLPGVAGVKTRARHLKLLAQTHFDVFDITTPACQNMVEASQLAGLNFIVNTIEDWRGTVAEVVAGDPIRPWEQGVSTAVTLANVPQEQRFDIAMVSAGGYLGDVTLYSAMEALHSGLTATRRDGVIVLVAECSRGVGPEGFLRGVTCSTSEPDVMSIIESEFEIGMERVRYLRRVQDTRRVIICSELRPSLVEEELRCVAVSDAQEGFEVARNMTKTRARIAAFANGTRTNPTVI
ncbi:MAG: lactate racemase domain-containing protein [Candidatus Thorarchaeota archaeon]